MKSIPLLISLIFMLLSVAGCSTGPYKNSADTANFISRLGTKNTRAEINTKLMAQHQEWRGTPYKMGGLSKQGIDCSGFVYLTYLKKFGINLPRSTEQQARVGIQIPPREMRTGDLVFFKTGFTISHVGIYLGNRKFLHASTSQGVKISNIDDDYWRDTFWKAQRI